MILINSIGAIAVTLMFNIMLTQTLINMGVPVIIPMILSLISGALVPILIIRWIYTPDNTGDKTPNNE